MNRHIRGYGIAMEQVLHAEEIAADDWRAVDCQLAPHQYLPKLIDDNCAPH